MTDMQGVIVPKSDQINADDLIAGPITVTIEAVKIKAGEDQPVSIVLTGNKKVYRPCKMMSRMLVAAWGSDSKAYTGRSLTLYRDPAVKWGGMAVGGIRISHMSDIGGSMTMALTETRGVRKPHTVKPLAKGAAPAAQTAAPPPPAVKVPVATEPPVSIEVPEADGAMDWRGWASAAGTAIRSAPDRAWLAEWCELNKHPFANFKRNAPKSGEQMQALIDQRNTEFDQSPAGHSPDPGGG